jgi:hypothetical protein
MTGPRVRVFLSCLLLVMLGGACGRDAGTATGHGQVVTKEVPVSAFWGIEAGSAFRVNVSSGTKESLVLRVDDALVDRVEA